MSGGLLQSNQLIRLLLRGRRVSSRVYAKSAYIERDALVQNLSWTQKSKNREEFSFFFSYFEALVVADSTLGKKHHTLVRADAVSEYVCREIPMAYRASTTEAILKQDIVKLNDIEYYVI